MSSDSNVPSGYNTSIPSQIMTPDRVQTRLGTLEFFDGMPTPETTALVFDNLDHARGVETFLNGIPAASVEALRQGWHSAGATGAHQPVVFDTLMDSNSLFLTGNTDTVYCMTFLDLLEDGPTVVEIPAGAGPGTVNDAYFRFVVDMGAPGPDRGEGGKYLILPPDYEGPEPEGYYVARSTSYANLILLRGFLVDGKPDAASQMWREGLKIYPLAKADQPPAMQFINGSGKAFNTIHANDYEFFEELHTVIDREPVEMLHPELRGLFASVGIEKGRPFAPDARMQAILRDAVAVGNATARAIFFRSRFEDQFLYEGSSWKLGYIGGSWEFLRNEGLGGRDLDARVHFYYMATINTPAMAAKMIGRGSQYAWGYLDKEGNYLDGRKTYRLNIPANVPAKDFWSVVAYDPQTRSELQSGQRFPSKNSRKSPLVVNDDGSVDLYFAPEAPEGHEANWIQTVPGKGWFVLLRLYGPLEAWFDKTWRPGDIELVG